MCVGESIIWVKLYWQRESLNFCDQPSCLSRCRFKSPNITFSQHDKAAPSTKELKSSMTLQPIRLLHTTAHAQLEPEVLQWACTTRSVRNHCGMGGKMQSCDVINQSNCSIWSCDVTSPPLNQSDCLFHICFTGHAQAEFLHCARATGTGR